MKQEITELQPLLTKHFAALVSRGELSHAYLFSGPAGTGRLELALWTAQAAFCEDRRDGRPCGKCSACRRIGEHVFPDVVEVAPDGASIKVDQIRFLKSEFSRSGVEGTKKFFIISDAEKMTAGAANSLLKFLEEPSGDVCAFLLTENAGLILPTIVSRCQEFELQAPGFDDLVAELEKDGISRDRAVFLVSLTDSLETARRLAADEEFSAMSSDVREWFRLVMAGDLRAFVNVTTRLRQYMTDRERQNLMLDMIVLLTRDVMLLGLDEESRVSVESLRGEMTAFSMRTGSDRTCRAVELVLDARKLMAVNVSFQNIVESLTLKLVSCYHE